MDLGIHGKVAMVAAGSKGIGLATAQFLAREGCRVSICGRNREALDHARTQIGHDAIAEVCDVSDPSQIERWFNATTATLGPAQILVTNTGGPPAGTLDDMTDEQWQAGFESTLMNVVRMVRIAQEPMKTAGWGRIVHITSVVAKEPTAMLPISATLRGGMMNLTRLQSNALAPFGITVNGVLPGHTLTDRQIHLCQMRADRNGTTLEEELEKQGQEAPVRRLGKPEEIAAMIGFLCSQQAAFTTGESILVDGGLTHGAG